MATTPEQSGAGLPLQLAERFARQPWNPGREVWTPAGVPGPIEEAVRWHLEAHPDEWGRANVSGDRAGVAASEVRQALGRIMARVSSRVYAEREGTGALVIFEPRDEGWPWGRDDEGDTLCRASALLWQEAEGLAGVARGWTQRDAWLERLRDRDGFEPWTKAGDLPALALSLLVSAFASKWKREHTVAALPLTQVAALTRAVGATKWALAKDEETLEDGTKRKREVARPVFQGPDGRPRTVAAASGPMEWIAKADTHAITRAGVMASLLAMLTHDAWQRGDAESDMVFIPGSRDGLKAFAGLEWDPDRIEDTLNTLTELWAGGWRLVDGWQKTKRPPRGGGLGPPTLWYHVEVGQGLHPWRGIKACAKAGVIPAGDMLTPVLGTLNGKMPLVGDHRTHDLQRVGWSLALPAVFVKHREEVLEQGGLEPGLIQSEWERLGCYRRSHADLTAKMMEAGLKAPAQLTLEGGARGPWLEQFKRDGKTLVRLGPDFGDAWRLIQADGELTKQARAAGLASAEARRLKRAKSRGQ